MFGTIVNAKIPDVAAVKVYQLEDRSPGAPKQVGASWVEPTPPTPSGTDNALGLHKV